MRASRRSSSRKEFERSESNVKVRLRDISYDSTKYHHRQRLRDYLSQNYLRRKNEASWIRTEAPCIQSHPAYYSALDSEAIIELFPERYVLVYDLSSGSPLTRVFRYKEDTYRALSLNIEWLTEGNMDWEARPIFLSEVFPEDIWWRYKDLWDNKSLGYFGKYFSDLCLWDNGQAPVRPKSEVFSDLKIPPPPGTRIIRI